MLRAAKEPAAALPLPDKPLRRCFYRIAAQVKIVYGIHMSGKRNNEARGFIKAGYVDHPDRPNVNLRHAAVRLGRGRGRRGGGPGGEPRGPTKKKKKNKK